MHDNVSTVIVLDGLDGSGKGSIANEAAKMLDGKTMIIDYPQYDFPWGKFLKHLLTEDDEGLSVQDRMLVYALNRLETVEAIQTQINEIPKGKKINLVFDRFVTSNIITAAYYYNKLPEEERTKNLSKWILDLYKYIQEIDADFLRLLKLNNAKVFVPMLSSEDTIKGVLSDITRDGADLYENFGVQELARQLYLIIAEAFPEKIQIFSQYKDGKRMTPIEQAAYVIELSGNNSAESRASVTNLQIENPTEFERINDLLKKYGSEKLQKYNPY